MEPKTVTFQMSELSDAQKTEEVEKY